MKATSILKTSIRAKQLNYTRVTIASMYFTCKYLTLSKQPMLSETQPLALCSLKAISTKYQKYLHSGYTQAKFILLL